MIVRSIRWRLTLSFAGIALLAAVALGAVLLIILQRYYAQREVDYLRGNAQIISATLAKITGPDIPREAIQLQLESLGFLSQTRIRVLDAEKNVVYDSGLPHKMDVSLGFVTQEVLNDPALSDDQRKVVRRMIALGDPMNPLFATAGAKVFGTALPGSAMDEALSPEETTTLKQMLADVVKSQTVDVKVQRNTQTNGSGTDPAAKKTQTNTDGIDPKIKQAQAEAANGGPAPDNSNGEKPADKVILYRSLAVAGSPFGFYLNGDIQPGAPRSAQTVATSYVDRNGKLQGTVELSDGPALGFDIVSSVAAGWAAASAVAVVLAAAVGWLISRRICAPVLALSQVTTRLARGDLSSRADAGGRDELGQLARAFNDMADQVETTVEALRRFVSDAAHELHSPLTALRTDLDLAADEMDAVRRQQFVDRARMMVARLERLTNNLLDLSRIEAKANAHEHRFDLAALVREHCEAYASEAEQAGLGFELSLPPGVVMLQAEPTQVARALKNLIDNSCKFTPQGGVVRCALARENRQIVLTVSDSGIGIPAEDLPQLFNRFHRGRNAVSYPGSGLGLAIVKAIMEQQGGTVVAENMPGGARFALQWPAASY